MHLQSSSYPRPRFRQGLAIGAIVGVTSFATAFALPSNGDGEASSSQEGPAPVYGVNSKGSTYSSDATDLERETVPDLVPVITSDGETGWVRSQELNTTPVSPQEAIRMQADGEEAQPLRVAAYDLQENEFVGWFESSPAEAGSGD